MSAEDRYTRQRRLREVGDAGQARIAIAQAEVRGSDGALIELIYLHRAGVQRAAITPGAEAEPFAHAEAFRFASSRSLAAGAWRALHKLRVLVDREEA